MIRISVSASGFDEDALNSNEPTSSDEEESSDDDELILSVVVRGGRSDLLVSRAFCECCWNGVVSIQSKDQIRRITTLVLAMVLKQT